MIAYKVVLIKGGKRLSTIGRFTVAKPHHSLILEYPKGAIVKAPKNTPGILVFNTRKNAVVFKYNMRGSISHFDVIKVKGIGKRREVKKLIDDTLLVRPFAEGGPKTWGWVVKKFRNLLSLTPPRGTMAFPAVEVLE